MPHLYSRTLSAAALALLIGAAPAAAINLPFGLGGGGEAPHAAAQMPAEAPVLLAQAGGDPGVRISQMEEEMRRLTGKVEEMSFLVLQLQEQLRNTQADNELRFQDLEGGAGSTSTTTPEERGDVTPQTQPTPAGPSSGDQDFALGLPSAAPSGASTPPSGPAPTDEVGALLDTASLETLGTSIPGSSPNAGSSPAAQAAGEGSQTVASISPSGAVEMYSLAYNYLLAGDYHLAENTFRQYADTYPESEDAPDARYWLGESLFAQNKYRDAAEVFLNAQKAHPDSGKAPEMMLKLGMSLARLENQDTACVTYAEVERRYPQMSDNVKRKLAEEETAANCG